VTISVFLSPASPGRDLPITRQCVITAPVSAPKDLM
jgi:hypothetical protein